MEPLGLRSLISELGSIPTQSLESKSTSSVCSSCQQVNWHSGTFLRDRLQALLLSINSDRSAAEEADSKHSQLGLWTLEKDFDDHLVAITSEGEICIFKGHDAPDDPDGNWRFVGNYYIGRPLGRRCLYKYGGDLLMILEHGVFPISKALQSQTIDKTVAVTDKIKPEFQRQALSVGGNFGWEICYYPAENFLVVNVPTSPNIQFTMASQSSSWCRFLSWDADCWAVFNGNLYYGTLEKVVKASIGSTDLGEAIQGDIVPAFNYFSTRIGTKHVDLIRIIWTSDGPFGYSIGACTDYIVSPPSVSVSASSTTLALWDVALWDRATWGTDLSRHQGMANDLQPPVLRLHPLHPRDNFAGSSIPGCRRLHIPGFYHSSMTPLLELDEIVLPWVQERIGNADATGTTIGVARGPNIVAGAIFHDYNGTNIFIHLAIVDPFATRFFLKLIGRYCFNQLDCKRLTLCTVSSNVQAVKLHEKLGRSWREG